MSEINLSPEAIENEKPKVRVGAIIVQNGRILMVGRNDIKHLWTPGGGVEPGEVFEETIRREIAEELDCEVVSISPYSEYTTGPQVIAGKDYPAREVHNFIVEISGNIRPSSEIENIYWLNGSELKDVILPEMFRDITIPRLIEEGLLEG